MPSGFGADAAERSSRENGVVGHSCPSLDPVLTSIHGIEICHLGGIFLPHSGKMKMSPPQAPTHHMPPAGQRDEDVAAFMDQQLAVDAPVALPRETPYPLAALATVSSLRTGTAAVRPSWLAGPPGSPGHT